MEKIIVFDMDGTIANLYAVENWLTALRSYDPTPYANALPLLNMSILARYLHKVQRVGYKVVIVSWLSKESTDEYDEAVTEAKIKWLTKHLPSVDFDEINIVPYGESKSNYANENSILFDDNEEIRNGFIGEAYEPKDIIRILKELAVECE